MQGLSLEKKPLWHELIYTKTNLKKKEKKEKKVSCQILPPLIGVRLSLEEKTTKHELIYTKH